MQGSFGMASRCVFEDVEKGVLIWKYGWMMRVDLGLI